MLFFLAPRAKRHHTVDSPTPEIHTLIPPSYICKFIPLLVYTCTEYNTWRELIQSMEGINFIPEWYTYQLMPWYHFHFLNVQTEVVKFMLKMAHLIPCHFYHMIDNLSTKVCDH